MREEWRLGLLRVIAVGCAAAVLLLIASATAAEPGPSAARRGSGAPPAAQASPSPPAPVTAAPSPAPDASASPSPTPEPPPRIIRAVCTDHTCGGCDGKCGRNGGHVAVDKKGHCACTPTEGSALDRAIRQASERRPSQ
jgi:hypothetical protein